MQTPAARPSTPSIKLTMFITATIPITVATSPRWIVAAAGQVEQVDGARVEAAEEGEGDGLDRDAGGDRDHGGDDWPSELQRRRQVEEVVERRRRTITPRRPGCGSRRPGQEDEAGDQDPARIASPPSRGVGNWCRPALARLVDRADAHARAASASGTSTQREDEGERKASEGFERWTGVSCRHSGRATG